MFANLEYPHRLLFPAAPLCTFVLTKPFYRMAEGAGALKRLYFLQDYAQLATSTLESGYKTVRGFVPSFVEPYFSQAEDLVTTHGAPYLTWAQDTADKFVRSVDGQVDAFANGLGGVLNYSRDQYGKNMSTFNAAKSEYYGVVESLVNNVKAKLDPTPYIQNAVETGKVYGEKAAYWADPDKVVDLGLEYYTMATSIGPVPKLKSAVEPSFIKYYTLLHDVVVANPLYKKGWDVVGATAVTVQGIPIVKKVVDVGYPYAAPFYDPVAANFTKSKYLKQLEAHLKPVA